MKRLISFILIWSLCFIGCVNKEKAIQRKLKVLEEEIGLAMMNQDFKVAEEKLLKSIELDPKSHVNRNNLAILYASKMNEPEKARELWTELLKEMPKNAAYLNNLAGIYQSLKDYEKAVELFTEAKKHHDSYHMPYYNIALIYLEQQKYPEALEELKKCHKLAADDYNVIAQLCKALILNGQWEEAKTLLQEKYDKYPKASFVSLILSRLHQRLGDYDASMKILDSSIESSPKVSLFYAEKIEIAFLQALDKSTIESLLTNYELTGDTVLNPWYPEMVRARIEIVFGSVSDGIQKLEALEGKIPDEWKYYDGIRWHVLAEQYAKAGQSDRVAIANQKAIENTPELYYVNPSPTPQPEG